MENAMGSDQSETQMIEAEGISQVFKLPSGTVKVLEDVDLTVEPKSFTVVHGPSGSGKTTLLNILAGLQKPTGGSVRVGGKRIYDLPSDQRAHFRSQTLGLVYQANYWVKSLSVLENVALPLYVSGEDMHSANQKAMETLKLLGMDRHAGHHPVILSGGEQQRVAMVRALVADPPLILADEPTGNLDSANGKMVMDLLKDIQKNLGRTIVLITHNLDYLSYSDHHVHLVDGRIRTAVPKQQPERIEVT